MSSLAPSALLCCSAFRSQGGEGVSQVSNAVSFYRTSTAGEKKNTMRKEQVLAETPNKTIYTQLGTLTQILPSWELIKNVTSLRGDHKQFLSPLLCPGVISFSVFLSLCTRTHPSLYESQGSPAKKNELLISL